MISRRTIIEAIDQVSGDIINANKIFKNKKIAHKYRTAYSKGEFKPECLICHQNLIVASSKNNLVHFEHEKNSDDCPLKSENVSQEEKEKLQKTFASKESPEHKSIKNKIGQLLRKTKGVNKNTVIVDKKYFKSEDGQPPRKPDVYCEFKGKKLAFEIQLSNLSQSYILDRAEFYKNKGMYLIWILEKFDPKNQSQMELDIKYLTSHQNFFSLDKSAHKELNLICEYKANYVSMEFKVNQKWYRKKIGLDQLNFDEENLQCYFNNYQEKEVKIRPKAIIEEIKEEKLSKSLDYQSTIKNVFRLNDDELNYLNDTLRLTSREINGVPILHYWIDNSSDLAYSRFISFWLTCHLINLNVNKSNVENVTTLQAILRNKNIPNPKSLIIDLLDRDYEFQDSDEKEIYNHFQDNFESQKFSTLCRLASKSPKYISADSIFQFSKIILILESIKQNEVICYNFKENKWSQFINIAINYYKGDWRFIESALKKYDRWEMTLKNDKNGSFRRELNKIEEQDIERKHDIYLIVSALYPEIL